MTQVVSAFSFSGEPFGVLRVYLFVAKWNIAVKLATKEACETRNDATAGWTGGGFQHGLISSKDMPQRSKSACFKAWPIGESHHS